MEVMDFKAEQLKFNALSQDDAKALLDAAEGQRPDFRSCWYCNGAHEHLKNRDVMLCFACGFHYLKGYPGPVVFKRSRGEEISDEDMRQFEEGLQEG